MTKSFRGKYFVLVLIFIIFLGLFIFSGFLFYLKPVIYAISPIPASHENVIVIKGRNLGSKVGDININDHYLMRSSIVSWRDEEIVFRITDEINSGLLFVKSDQGFSNELFLVIRRQVPVKLESENKPLLFDTESLVLTTNIPVALRGRNLASDFSVVEVFVQAKQQLYKVLLQDILKISRDEIEFIPPRTVNHKGEVFLLVDGVKSNKIPFNFKSNFFKWTLGEFKNFKISQEIYFEQGSDKDSKLKRDDINFNVFYLGPIENERQKIKFLNNDGTDLGLNNLFFKSLKVNKHYLKFEIEAHRLSLEVIGDEHFLYDIKVNKNNDMHEFKTYVLNKRNNYLLYDSLDLSPITARMNKIDGESAYKLAKSLIDALVLYFKITDNNSLSLEESIRRKEISEDNLITLTNLLFLQEGIPLRTAVGFYFDSESSVLKNHTWCEFFLDSIGFIYFDIIKAVLFKNSSKYFMNMSENYIHYGYKESFDDYLSPNEYMDLGLLKYKSLTNRDYSLNYSFTLEENINAR
ncbi:IPT/TIG domain-containing protein [Borrelia sp. RT5S]|uniref:IPT/TIG domain-containing protein n=1 Tax=Borrelia sp. RT5S TaxID=2898581 RepID=UPI001E607CE1|nr:IPT/TIG domain-containing protein [Borrelia sp. RT5S]UGQ16548.1 DNA-binding protein [Borrelia sp. RT5S]